MSVFAILLIIVNLILLYQICRSQKVHIMLKIIWCVSYVGWSALPLVLTMSPSFTNMVTIPFDFYLTYASLNQIALCLMNIYAFYLINTRRLPKIFVKNDFQDSVKFNKVLFWISSILLIFVIFRLMTTSLGYQERNDVEYMSSNSSLGFLSLLEDLAVFTILAQIIWKRDVLGKAKLLSGELLLSCYVLMQIYNGRRIYMFFFVIVLLYFSYKTSKKKYLIYACCGGLLALWLLPIIGEIRQEDKIHVDKIVEAGENDDNDILNQVILKTNSVQYSCYLLLHDGIGQQGPKLYTSTLYALVPRIIYPDKPIPGSVDGTLNGIPARLNANYHRDSHSDVENNGVTSSLEALWALGWFMFILQIFISGYVIYLFNGILYGGKPLFIYFMFSLIGFPVCVMDVSLVKLLLSIQRYIIIYIFFKLIFRTNK